MEASSPRAILWSPHETGDAQKSQRPVQPQLESHIAYLDLDVDFEECERQASLILIKKYQRLFRSLFMRYSNVGFKIAPLHERNSFEGLKQAQESISLTEVLKMLKDHLSYSAPISKDDLNVLFRVVQVKNG